MACFHPLQGWQTKSGKITLTPMNKDPITVPCGNCIGCRVDRARDWSIRCTHESQMHETNLFITLSYDEENLPEHGSLNHKDFQRFIQRVRRYMDPENKIRYFMCGEYGPRGGRPHYHAILFGVEYPDMYLWREEGNYQYFRSPTLEKHWPYGNSELTLFSTQTANYVAGYILKKQTGPKGKRERERLIPETGEIIELQEEYVRASNRPGIGHSWYQLYKTDLYPGDFAVMDGKKWPVPRYYDKLYKEENPEAFEEILERRIEFANCHEYDNTSHRLKQRKECALQRHDRSIKRETLENDLESIQRLRLSSESLHDTVVPAPRGSGPARVRQRDQSGRSSVLR